MEMECPEDHKDLFCPSNAGRVIDGYLRPKIAGKDVDSAYVHDADVCSDHPYDLVRRHAPAPGTGDGDGRAWFFFSPERYVGGGGKTSARGGGSRSGHRARAVLGADGKKKGTWHAEGKKEAVAGTAGGYCRSLTYHQVTPSGSFVKPGWLMVEYGVDDEHGDSGGVVLCKVYKSRRGPGSGVPSRKRKAANVEAASTSSLLPRQRRTHYDDGDVVSCNKAAAQRQETELVPLAAQAYQGDLHSGDGDAFTMLRAFMETDEDEMALQPPADFDPVEYLLGEHKPCPGPAVPPPPCAAHQPEGCAQTSAGDDDEIEFSFTLEELMGSSPPGQCSATPSPLLFGNDACAPWCARPWMAPALCAV